MVIKKSLLIAGFVGALGLSTIAGVSAQSGKNYSATLSEKIAQEYNLDQIEVQTLIEATREEVREEHQAEREAAFTARLEQAVEDGTITEEQKETILDFHTEQQNAREALRDLEDDEERRAAHQALHEAREAFMDENSDIPFEDLKPEDGEQRGRHKEFGPRGFGGDHDTELEDEA